MICKNQRDQDVSPLAKNDMKCIPNEIELNLKNQDSENRRTKKKEAKIQAQIDKNSLKVW